MVILRGIMDWIRKKRSLFNTWVFSYIAVLLIPLIICSVIYAKSYSMIKAEIMTSNSTMLKHFATMLDVKFKDLSDIELSLQDDAKLKEIAGFKQPLGVNDKYKILNYVRNEMIFKKRLSDFISYYYIYFPMGQFVLKPGGYSSSENAYYEFASDDNFSQQEWTTLLKEKHYKKFISIKKNDGNFILYLHSMPETGSSVRMNFVTLLNSEYLKALSKSFKSLKGSVFLIMDSSGDIIFSTVGNEGMEIAYHDLPKDAEVFSKKINGQEMVLSYVTSAVTDLRYVFAIPSSVFWQKAVSLMYLSVIAVLFCIGLGFYMAFVFSKKNYLPVNNLVNMLQTKSKYERNYEDEHKFIASTVSHMMDEHENICDMLQKRNNETKKVVLSKILSGGFDEKSIINMLESYGVDFPDGNFAVIICSLDNYENFFENTEDQKYKDDNIYIIEYAIISLIEELLSKKFRYQITEVNGSLTCIINFADIDKNSCKLEIQNIAMLAKTLFSEGLYVTVTIAVSGIHSRKSEIHQAYEEAIKALEKRLIIGENCVISYSDSEGNSDGSGYHYSIETETKLLNNIKQGNTKEACEILDEIFRKNLERDRLSINMVKYLMYELSGTILKVVSDLDCNLKVDADLMSKMMNCNTVFETHITIKEVIKQVCNQVNIGKKSHNVRLKDDIINYIDKDYSNPGLSNSMIADKFGIKPAYLSRFFKEQTGDNILNYINKIRVEKAKTLLLEKKYTLEEISGMIGYSNSVALIRNFKKCEGITPGVYGTSDNLGKV